MCSRVEPFSFDWLMLLTHKYPNLHWQLKVSTDLECAIHVHSLILSFHVNNYKIHFVISSRTLEYDPFGRLEAL